MKNLKLAAVCLSCLTMTGCSALNFSVEGLINAPKLTSEQSEIHQALIESVGSNITLKYPKTVNTARLMLSQISTMSLRTRLWSSMSTLQTDLRRTA